MIKEAGMDFRHKEVVNINNGKRLGYVQDVCADLETGRITSIIVPGSKKMMNIFSKDDDIVIEWDRIKCIGDDIILVDIWLVLKIVLKKKKKVEKGVDFSIWLW